MMEVTARTLQGRSLLRPGSRFNRIYYGVLARAQSITGTQIHAFACLSTYRHILVSVEDAQELARFPSGCFPPPRAFIPIAASR